MKRFSLLLATAILVQSASGIPIVGKRGCWEHLTNRYKHHAAILKQRKSANSSRIFYSNLCDIEKNIEALNLSDNTDVWILETFSNVMHDELALTVTPVSLNHLKTMIINRIKEEKAKFETITTIKPLEESTQISPVSAKKTIFLALSAAALYFAITNKDVLQKKASEFASSVKASDFASQVKEVGAKISASFTELSDQLVKGAVHAAAATTQKVSEVAGTITTELADSAKTI